MVSANYANCLSHHHKRVTKTEKIQGITRYTLKHFAFASSNLLPSKNYLFPFKNR